MKRCISHWSHALVLCLSETVRLWLQFCWVSIFFSLLLISSSSSLDSQPFMNSLDLLILQFYKDVSTYKSFITMVGIVKQSLPIRIEVDVGMCDGDLTFTIILPLSNLFIVSVSRSTWWKDLNYLQGFWLNWDAKHVQEFPPSAPNIRIPVAPYYY